MDGEFSLGLIAWSLGASVVATIVVCVILTIIDRLRR